MEKQTSQETPKVVMLPRGAEKIVLDDMDVFESFVIAFPSIDGIEYAKYDKDNCFRGWYDVKSPNEYIIPIGALAAIPDQTGRFSHFIVQLSTLDGVRYVRLDIDGKFIQYCDVRNIDDMKDDCAWPCVYVGKICIC